MVTINQNNENISFLRYVCMCAHMCVKEINKRDDNQNSITCFKAIIENVVLGC